MFGACFKEVSESKIYKELCNIKLNKNSMRILKLEAESYFFLYLY